MRTIGLPPPVGRPMPEKDIRRKIRRTNIYPIALVGDDEFFEAYGINSSMLSAMRSDGLPCRPLGRSFIYYPDEVDSWIKRNYKLQTPKTKTT